jgi:hypothetical protein
MGAYKSGFQEERQISYKKPSSCGSGRTKLTLPPDRIPYTTLSFCPLSEAVDISVARNGKIFLLSWKRNIIIQLHINLR